ncbi:MAG TPA: hypothetical protein VJ623_12050 [Holophagaceae bacterium]|nr:hypothetical protein [Holophagaceae bacterium]
MHPLLARALTPGSGASALGPQAVLPWVATGSPEAAQGLALIEPARNGWRAAAPSHTIR